MEILVFGSGGVGGYYGARLQQGGHRVRFVARGAHGRAMRERGLTIRSEPGDATLPVEVSETPAPAELVLLAVKLWDTEDAARAIASVARADTTVISLQNGVEKDEVLARALGKERVLGGVTHIGAVIAEPGVIAQTGKLARITLGELPRGTSPRAERVAAALGVPGIEVKRSDEMLRTTWEKFCFLTAFSGLTALTRKPIGELRAHPVTRAFYERLLREAAAVARASGVALLAGYEEEQLVALDALPAAMTSSMAQDLARGQRLELPWLSGAVVRRGRAVGVPVPAHEAVEAGLALHAGG